MVYLVDSTNNLKYIDIIIMLIIIFYNKINKLKWFFYLLFIIYYYKFYFPLFMLKLILMALLKGIVTI